MARRGLNKDICFIRKQDAVRIFANQNRDVIDAFGGMLKTGGKGEFDAINERYSLRGRRRVKNIDQAIRAVLPMARPYCLDKLDLETLNETAPAQHVAPFRLPSNVEEAIAAKRYAEEYAQHVLEGIRRKKLRRRR